MQSNNLIRDISVPFTATPYNNMDFNVSGINPSCIRFSIPKNSRIKELYLSIKIENAPSDINFKIAIGYFKSTTNNEYVAETSYTSDYINASHLKIKGDSNKYSVLTGQTVLIDGINLTNAIDPNDYGIVLITDFDSYPDFTVNGTINYKLTGSAILGVL